MNKNSHLWEAEVSWKQSRRDLPFHGILTFKLGNGLTQPKNKIKAKILKKQLQSKSKQKQMNVNGNIAQRRELF